MIPDQDSSRSLRARKPLYTYSFTVTGGSFSLITNPPLLHAALTRPTPSSSPPTLATCNVLDYVPSASPSVSGYFPCLPISRGPRSTNLYLYRPTAADYDKARKRRILKAVALEDALKERKDDERRRNDILGVAVSRRSTRQSKAKSTLDLGDAKVAAEQPPCIERLKGRNYRGTVNHKFIAFGFPRVTVPAVSPAASSLSTSLPSRSPSAEGSTKKPRRKGQPKVNSKPTERLTTRSLARAQRASLPGRFETDTLSIAASEASENDTMDIDLEIHDEPISEGSSTGLNAHVQAFVQVPKYLASNQMSTETTPSITPSASSETTQLEGTSDRSLRRSVNRLDRLRCATPPPVGTSLHLEENPRTRGVSLAPLAHSRARGGSSAHGPSPLSQSHLSKYDGEDTDSRRSFSGEAQSSATLCDSESMTLDIKQEFIANVITPVKFITQEDEMGGYVDNLPPSSQSSTPASSSSVLQGHSTSSTSTAAPSPPDTPSSTAVRLNKRKLDSIDVNSKFPPLVGSRRTSRVPKKRRIY